jgi:hypothetical protein
MGGIGLSHPEMMKEWQRRLNEEQKRLKQPWRPGPWQAALITALVMFLLMRAW